MADNPSRRDRGGNAHTLNLDDVVTTQPELGPSIPDGGWGWIIFPGTLFFQILIPCLIVNFGIFLAFSKLQNGTAYEKNLQLWSDNILYAPLFFSIGFSVFDSVTRKLASKTTTTRLTTVVGTCLTCSGLLFVWLGITSTNEKWLFIPAGFISGLGASIILAECEVILAQYFRLKLPILIQISQCAAALGFLIAPVTLGHYILSTSITHVLLWYQAIILQGLIIALTFKKPLYLKSKSARPPYQFVTSSPEDEEDVFSKNARELQLKRATRPDTGTEEPQPSTSSDKKQWEVFEDEEDLKTPNWERFHEESPEPKRSNWEKFEDAPDSPDIINHLPFSEEAKKDSRPASLFSDLPVNNNNTYTYEDEIGRDVEQPHVFVPNTINSDSVSKSLHLFKQPSFYKSLLMLTTNRYSTFVFYVLFPSYLYIESETLNIRHMAGIIGALALVTLIFLSVFFWIPIDQKRRPLAFFMFYWIGAVGYFMISDFTNEYVLLIGAIQITLSISALNFVSRPLLGISSKGETSPEYFMLSTWSGLALFLFLFLNCSYKTCFRLVAIFEFFTGTLWLANYIYKKIRIR